MAKKKKILSTIDITVWITKTSMKHRVNVSPLRTSHEKTQPSRVDTFSRSIL